MRIASTRWLAGTVTVAGLFCATAAYIPGAPAVAALRATPRYTKVLVIAEENHTYSEIVGSKQAPYLTKLAATYGNATNMTANYPADCPSLAEYILITSGTTDGICDDKVPKKHPLAGSNIFAQVAAAGLSWRTYAQHMPKPCAHTDSGHDVFLVRHTPVAYYTSERNRCPVDDVPMGTLDR